MSVEGQSAILVASCPDRVGITRAVSSFIYDYGAGITQSDQFSESGTERFFMRYEFQGFTQALPDIESMREAFRPVAEAFEMNWALHDALVKPRVLLAVSRIGHCLNDLLYRWQNGDLAVTVVGVVSNHQELRSSVEWHGLPFHYLPISKETRRQQENSIVRLVEDENVDLMVLARYMQILSPDLCQQLEGRVINIHHSFLPSFKGAKPYHQAHQRGVKLIGATAHYVTSDLDEGPIIEQDVHRISHSMSSQEVVRVGSDIECRVLARAVKWHCEHRVLLSGHRTVVFN